MSYVTQLLPPLRRRALAVTAAAALALCSLAAGVALAGFDALDLIRTATGLEDDYNQGKSGDLRGVIVVGERLLTPAMVIALAVAPLVCVAGAILWQAGARMGPRIVITALAVATLISSIRGIFA